MPRRLLRKYLPHRNKALEGRIMRLFKPLHDRHYLWHLNRKTVSRAVALGMFWAWIPVVGQGLVAILMAAKWRANVLVAWVTTWASNPFTLVPHWWLAYKMGRWILGTPEIDLNDYWRHFSSVGWRWWFSWDAWLWFGDHAWGFYWPLMAGSLVISIVTAIMGYFVAQWGWRWYVASRWKRRLAKAIPR